MSPALVGEFFTMEPPGKPRHLVLLFIYDSGRREVRLGYVQGEGKSDLVASKNKPGISALAHWLPCLHLAWCALTNTRQD